jgi:hypothetical protein
MLIIYALFIANKMPKLARLGALCTLLTLPLGRDSLHLATDSLLQMHPSFTGNGVMLCPGLRPGHNTSDHQNLTPTPNNELYYAQEGHPSESTSPSDVLCTVGELSDHYI